MKCSSNPLSRLFYAHRTLLTISLCSIGKSGLTNPRTPMSIHHVCITLVGNSPPPRREIGTCAVVIPYTHRSLTLDGSVNVDLLPLYQDFYCYCYFALSRLRYLWLPTLSSPTLESRCAETLIFSCRTFATSRPRDLNLPIFGSPTCEPQAHDMPMPCVTGSL
jgi:hypothetical protein